MTWWGCCRQARVPIFVVGSDVNGSSEVQVGRGGASAGESGSRGILRCQRAIPSCYAHAIAMCEWLPCSFIKIMQSEALQFNFGRVNSNN